MKLEHEDELLLKPIAYYYALAQLGKDKEEDEIPVEKLQRSFELLSDPETEKWFENQIEKFKKELLKPKKKVKK